MPSEPEVRRSVTVAELSDTMAGALRNMAPPRPGICPICWTFHDPAYPVCVGCNGPQSPLDIVVPISYAPRGGQLAVALRGYKDELLYATRYHHAMRLAAILWRFLGSHEGHIAKACGVDAFDTVAVVPSKTTENDEARPGLRTIVGTVVGATAARWRRVLKPSDAKLVGRFYDPGRYTATEPLDGNAVLLIDDAWVSGSSARSAAAGLRDAGATHVACVVIGGWLTPSYGGDWGTVSDLYRKLPKEFDWTTCAPELLPRS